MRTRFIASVFLLTACQQEFGRPPVPRFTVDPQYILTGDDYATRVTLDSSGSADELDDPTAPLDVDWSFDDERVRVVEGSRHSPTLVLTAPGERPVTIVLTVTDPDGRSSSLSQRLGVTLPEE